MEAKQEGASPLKKKYSSYFNPLQPNMDIHILHTVLDTFLWCWQGDQKHFLQIISYILIITMLISAEIQSRETRCQSLIKGKRVNQVVIMIHDWRERGI